MTIVIQPCFISALVKDDAGSIFNMLACNEHRNVTFVLDGVSLETFDLLISYLSEVTKNEACYSIHFFSEKADRFIPFNGRDKEVNILTSGFNGPMFNGVLSAELRKKNRTLYDQLVEEFEEEHQPRYAKISKALSLLRNAPKADNNVKQTFVFMVESKTEEKIPRKVISQLQKLQREKKWDLIFYCHKNRCPSKKWIARHRIIEVNRTYAVEKIPDLIDLVKEPDFNRFKFKDALFRRISGHQVKMR